MAGPDQLWIMDRFLERFGLDILHPEIQRTMEFCGYDHNDYLRVSSLVKAGNHLAKSWATVAHEAERKAENIEARGLKLTAAALYLRATLCYGRARYMFFSDDPKKFALSDKVRSCYDRVIELSPTPVERVEIPFEGKTVYAILHLPANAKKVPCVILVPGLDMFKEDWHHPAHNVFLPRGMAAMAIDGPGQGEALLKGLKVTVDNYERAGKAVIDYLMVRPEIDPDKIVVYGCSWGSYHSPRIAAYDDRVKAVAVAMGSWHKDGTTTSYVSTQPNFRINYGYVTGLRDDELDEKYLKHKHLGDIIPKLKCPILLAHGEIDELHPTEVVLECYQRIKAPKEIWLFEDQFHSLGGVAGEAFPAMADWLLEMLAGRYEASMDNQFFIRLDGTYHRGLDKRNWWLT